MKIQSIDTFKNLNSIVRHSTSKKTSLSSEEKEIFDKMFPLLFGESFTLQFCDKNNNHPMVSISRNDDDTITVEFDETMFI